MKYVLSRLAPLLLFLVVAFASFFYSHRTAIDSSLRYRPLANGWISIYAPIQMSDSLTLAEKIEKTIEEDLVHGRFRPAFFFYSTISYALSPLFHGKITAGEGRKYHELMTGDQRLYGIILLVSLVLATWLMALLLCRYIRAKAFILVPLVFIPLSPSATENLLHFYIDSQEIPLILWTVLWLFFLFKALHSRPGKHLVCGVSFSFSILFFLLAFLTKETMLVVVFPLFIYTCFIAYQRLSGKVEDLPGKGKYVVGTFLFSIVCAVGVSVIVLVNKHGYASSYQTINVQALQAAIRQLWSCVSLFSLHNVYGLLPIVISWIVLFLQRGQRINGLTVSSHFIFSLFFLSLSYGFLFVLAPWNPILVKYVLPSVFFFSFLVAFSLGIIADWLKKICAWKHCEYAAYALLLPYMFLFADFYKNADELRGSLFNRANYGVEVLDKVADSIDKELKRGNRQSHKVFVGFEVRNVWEHHIQWSTLQLKRILNFEKSYNLRSYDGKAICNTAMPQDELTSFICSPGWKTLFLSENHGDLEVDVFDIVYKGFLEGEAIPETLQFGRWYYQNAGEIVEYKSRFDLPAFRIAQFLPVNCAETDKVKPAVENTEVCGTRL